MEININNMNNKKDYNYNNNGIENKKNNNLFSYTYTNSLLYKKEDNKSPLKISLQLSNKIPRKKLLNNIKKSNINLKIVDDNKTKGRNIFDFHHGLNLKKEKMYKTSLKFNTNEKNKKNLIIGDKNISISELKNRFNDMQFLSEENIDLIQVIQSNKYNDMNNNDISELDKRKSEIFKSPILKGRSNYLRYHLSFVPLNEDKLAKKNINTNTFNKETKTSNLNSFQLSIFSNKSNNTNKQLETINYNKGNNNRDSNTFNDNQLIPSIIEKYKDKKTQKKIYNDSSKNNHKISKINSNEKIKGHINKKIKEFYDQLKSQGCLSCIHKSLNNKFFTRKYKQKYKSALKHNHNLFSNNSSQTDLSKTKIQFLPFINE